MAVTIRKLIDLLVPGLVTYVNANRLDIMKVKAGTIFHGEQAPAALVATAAATDLATSVALANALKAAYNTHIASIVSVTTGQGAHIVSGGTALATAAATDLATAITLANAIKAAYNTHVALTTAHPTADATNTIAAATATDQSSVNTMLNEIKADLNLHIAASFASQVINQVAP